MVAEQQKATLKRGLKNRHIQLIALGGAIGTGLFLGIGPAIEMAGPAVLLGYAIVGVIAFLIMRQLGEMVVEEPVAGSFAHFSYKYWGPFAGFVSGWNYWVLFVLVGMAELTAAGIYMQYWWPEIPTWVWAAVFFMVINAINLIHVRFYGEIEFWFAIIKVVAILCMIGFGAWLIIYGGQPHTGMANLWQNGGFLAKGWHGLMMSLAVIMFSFGGLELLGLTAAEADEPRKTIPKATNQIVYRILIFYMGSLLVLLCLYPWQKIEAGSSPFVMIFHDLDSVWVAKILNIVILTAALSVYNSCVYSNSRMLYGLAVQGNAAPKLAQVNKRGIPVLSIALSAVVTSLVILVNYLIPGKAFELLMALVVSTLVINWVMICMAHLKFRAAKQAAGVKSHFSSPGYPVSNYLCLAFLALILVIMLMTPAIRISVILLPIWLAFLWLGFRLSRRKGGS